MILNILLVMNYICFSIQELFKNGVYNFLTNNLYLYNNKNKLILSNNFQYPNTFFRLKKNKLLNDSFYSIEEIYSKSKLKFSENKELYFTHENIDFNLWNFIEVNEKNFVIKNIKNCFLEIIQSKIFCVSIPFNEASRFKLVKIYSEINEKKNKNYYDLINQKPVDVLIKYIDLRDPNLNRVGIHQIEKDYDNEELRYSIRSILHNIPWVRKIFILMPNEKVRYFKEYNLIKEKIVYVKDKDILGYDSSNSYAFQFNYWKMKKFGISDNVILMDDDYFIGNKLQKNDFFYIKKGKITPAIVTSNFLKINNRLVQKNLEIYEKKAKMNNLEQNDDCFNYSKYLTFSFILSIFNVPLNESIFIPKFTHNAIPVNLRDIKEIYDLVYNSRYKAATIDSLYRNIDSLQFQILFLSYTFIKYNRKVKNIPYKYLILNNSISGNYKFPLFCINKRAGNYSYLNFNKARITMEYLFPFPTIYEIVNYSIINLSFNVVYSMDKIIKTYENKEARATILRDFFYFETIFIINIILILFKFNLKNYYEFI